MRAMAAGPHQGQSNIPVSKMTSKFCAGVPMEICKSSNKRQQTIHHFSE